MKTFVVLPSPYEFPDGVIKSLCCPEVWLFFTVHIQCTVSNMYCTHIKPVSVQLHIPYGRLDHCKVFLSSIGWHQRAVSRLMGQESKKKKKSGQIFDSFLYFLEVLRYEYLKSKLCWEVQDTWSPWMWGFDFFHRFTSPLSVFCHLPKIGEPSIYSTTVCWESISYLALFSSVQSLSRVWLFVTAWTAARQASLSITNSWKPPKFMSIESVIQSHHLILCCPLLLLPSVFPSIRVFFKWVSSSHQVAKVLEFQLQHQSFQWTPRTDLL